MDRGDKFCQNRGFWSVKIQLFQISTYDTSLEAQFYADQTLRKNLGPKINRKEGTFNFLTVTFMKKCLLCHRKQGKSFCQSKYINIIENREKY